MIFKEIKKNSKFAIKNKEFANKKYFRDISISRFEKIKQNKPKKHIFNSNVFDHEDFYSFTIKFSNKMIENILNLPKIFIEMNSATLLTQDKFKNIGDF